MKNLLVLAALGVAGLAIIALIIAETNGFEPDKRRQLNGLDYGPAPREHAVQLCPAMQHWRITRRIGRNGRSH
jgi:hypothetical protein